MLQRIKTTMTASIVAASLGGCGTNTHQTTLTADIGAPVHYTNDNGDQFEAKYGALSDDSLHFVKVKMPDGQEYTLPQALSASGVRYTDDRELVWWEHQGTVAVDIRDAEGNWISKYPELREVPEKQ